MQGLVEASQGNQFSWAAQRAGRLDHENWFPCDAAKLLRWISRRDKKGLPILEKLLYNG